jgi:hypothetical protein
MTHLLQLHCLTVIARAHLPVRSTQDPGAEGDEEEDSCEDSVRFQGKDKEREECEAPDNQVERNSCIVCRRHSSFGRGSCR